MEDLIECLKSLRMTIQKNENALVAFSPFYAPYPIMIKVVVDSCRADIEIRDAHLQLMISTHQKNKYEKAILMLRSNTEEAISRFSGTPLNVGEESKISSTDDPT